MMKSDVEELILTIVRPLVKQPDKISVEVIEHETVMEYHLRVAGGDRARLIDHHKKVISSIRSVIYFVQSEEKQIRFLVDKEQ